MCGEGGGVATRREWIEPRSSNAELFVSPCQRHAIWSLAEEGVVCDVDVDQKHQAPRLLFNSRNLICNNFWR